MYLSREVTQEGFVVFGLSFMHAGFPRVWWVALRGKVVKCSVCAPVTVQCCACGEPIRLSSDMLNELSQPWPLPALLGQGQGREVTERGHGAERLVVVWGWHCPSGCGM